jgi:hypothetical protein
MASSTRARRLSGLSASARPKISQAERQIEEALAVVTVERDRMEVVLHRLVEPVGGAQRVAEVGMQRRIVGLGRQRQAMMRHRGFELARESERHAEIVVQLGVIGPHGQELQVRGDRLFEAAGAMGLRGQAELLDECVIATEQRRRHSRGPRFLT